MHILLDFMHYCLVYDKVVGYTYTYMNHDYVCVCVCVAH